MTTQQALANLNAQGAVWNNAHGVKQDERPGMEYLWTGWVGGSLYVSADGGQTWRPSDLRFQY